MVRAARNSACSMDTLSLISELAKIGGEDSHYFQLNFSLQKSTQKIA
jgi:hypothetical protein